MRSRGTWMLLALICALAGARWWVMSSPDHFSPWLPSAWFRGDALGFTELGANAASSGLFLVLLPLLALWPFRDRSPAGPVARTELAWLRGPRPVSRLTHLLIGGTWAGALALGLAATQAFSSLRETYPIAFAAGGSPLTLLASELLVLALLLSTEIFYRGIALSLLQPRVGRAAIYLLAPIYALDHVGAPAAEIAGSALAAILLGHLALATRSIWPGLVAHAICAISVDISSLWIEDRLWFQ